MLTSRFFLGGLRVSKRPVSTLFAALLARAPPAVVLAILEAAPAIVRVLNPSNGETALHCALQGLDHDAYIDDGQRHGDANGNPRQPEEEDAVLLPLIAAWPESVAMRPNDDDDQATHTRTPLHYAMVYGASATVVKASIQHHPAPSSTIQCSAVQCSAVQCWGCSRTLVGPTG